MTRRDLSPQLVARAVGVAIQLGQRRLDRFNRARRRSQGIFVRCQLYRLDDSELALQLLDGLARFIGSKRGDRGEYEILCFDQNRRTATEKSLTARLRQRPTFLQDTILRPSRIEPCSKEI